MAVALPDYCIRPSAVLQDDVIWRHDKVPDYSAADATYAKEKTVDHEPGSLGDIVSNLVKNWEKELSYKTRPQDIRTMNVDKFQFSVNGGPKMDVKQLLALGSYNALIGDQALYCASKSSFEESHECFRKAMPGGFSWEVLDVYSGPPKVAFKWRHWGQFTGPLACPLASGETKMFPPTGKKVEITGIAIAEVDDDMRITNLEVYNDPTEPMKQMAGVAAP